MPQLLIRFHPHPRYGHSTLKNLKKQWIFEKAIVGLIFINIKMTCNKACNKDISES